MMQFNGQRSENQADDGVVLNVEVSDEGPGKAFLSISYGGEDFGSERSIWLTQRQTRALRDKLTKILRTVEDTEDLPEIEED